MSKLARKFLLSLSSILIVVILVSIYLNSNFTQRYSLYREKQDLAHICDAIATSDDLSITIPRLEEETDVVIAWVENTEDNNLLNGRLREDFQRKGLGLGGYGNFWLWVGDQQEISEKGHKLRIYYQEKLPYSLLVQYVGLGEDFIAVAKIIPAVQQTIALVNLVTACVFSAAALVMIALIFILVKKITTPLTAIGETAKAIAMLNFGTVEVKTGDELEQLAQNINDMSGKLQAAHEELETKNRQMESLLANVSHDLKTPVSLIKAYTGGIKDGMDDGTFLDIIIRQNEKMEQMIERLLGLVKVQQQMLVVENIDLAALLQDTIAEQQLQAAKRGLLFLCQMETPMMQSVSKEAVQTIFSNLLSNAVKYAVGEHIRVTLKNDAEGCLFETENEVNPTSNIDTEQLWEAFYVAEESRNKDLSGTGLGLAIVRAAVQKEGYRCACTLVDGKIRFSIWF